LRRAFPPDAPPVDAEAEIEQTKDPVALSRQSRRRINLTRPLRDINKRSFFSNAYTRI
jgi:hypothetical protein